jgi:WD40-like Beta Propeller Repeat
MATGFTTVSASHLTDATGTVVANATISFQPCNEAGVPLSFRVNGDGQAMSQAVSATITNGVFTIQLADTTLTFPENIAYATTIIDNVSGKSLLGPGYLIQPFGAAMNFDIFTPNVPALTTIQTGPPNVLSIGSVTTLPAGASASATITGTSPEQTLSLAIPQGVQGIQGVPGPVGGALATATPLVASGAGSAGVATTSSASDHVHPSEVAGKAIAPASVNVDGQATIGPGSALNPLDTDFSITDSSGNAAFYVDESGHAVMPIGAVVGSLTLTGDIDAPGLVINDTTLQNGTEKGIHAYVVNDSSGNVVSQVDADGSVFSPLGIKGKFIAKSAMDGDGFVYYSALDGQGGSWQIFKVDPLSANTWKLTAEGNNYSPAISQDGNKVVFVTDRYGSEQAAIMGLWGGTVTPATENLATLYGWNFLGSIGQSLAEGYATNALTLTQPGTNLTFSTGPRAGVTGNVTIPPANMTTAMPLVEVNNEDYLGAANDGETMSSGSANRMQADLLSQGILSTFFAGVSARGDTGYSAMAKGTVCYANMLAQVTAAQTLAVAAGKSFGMIGMMCSEGGADETAGTQNFDQYLRQWWSNYNADIAAITGQTTKFPLLYNQDSGWGTAATGIIAFAQLKAHETHPGDLILTNPMYSIPFNAGTGHMTADGYRQSGEYMGKVLERTLLGQKAWRPTSPRFIQRVGNQIMVTFHVPVGPLVLDTTTITPPTYYAGGLNGFEYFDNSGAPPAITSTTLVGSNKVLITLASVPTVPVGAGFIRYAYTAQAGAANIPSPTTGPRGCLRDSDTSTSVYGYSMWNWCVHFNKAC